MNKFLQCKNFFKRISIVEWIDLLKLEYLLKCRKLTSVILNLKICGFFLSLEICTVTI